MKQSLTLAILGTGALLLTGCQNSLRIEVVLLDVGGMEHLTKTSYPEAVKRSQNSLSSFISLVQGLETELNEVGQKERITSVSSDDIKDANELKNQGDVLLNRLTNAVGEDVTKSAAAVRKYTRQVLDFTARKSGYEQTLLQGIASDSEIGKKMKIAFESVKWDTEFAKIKEESALATVDSAGFGGFTAVAAHQIDGSDSRYKHVLKAKPIGVPFTMVEAQVSGDSTLIFVQESPTQVRAFSVDLDPTQLVHNIIFIADKALQAATKFVAVAP